MTNKIELLMPAGDLPRLKACLLYGADAVFIGGKRFSLRAKASNFTIDDIKEGVEFAHALNKKVYVTVNIVPHVNDLKDIEQYLYDLQNVGVDAVIVSSLAIVMFMKENNFTMECHISTQVSASNASYLDFYQRLNCPRVVLARECTIEDIKSIRKHNDLELEVFIQGGLCSSYSGRCTLSNYFVCRDANRGGCAHSCRWDYTLYQNGEKVADDTFKIASKDLMGICQVPALIEAGVSSLKVEGRMKSLNYVAIVARTYRKIIDLCYEGTLIEQDLIEAGNELSKIENRPLCTGYLGGDGQYNALQIYQDESRMVNQTYLGIIDKECENGLVKIIRKNDIYVGQKVEIYGYDIEPVEFVIDQLFDDDGEITIANNTQKNVFIKLPIKVKQYYLLRQK